MKLLGVMHTEDESPASLSFLSELFHGFQTVMSSLGKNVFITDLATPKFSTYVDNMMKNGIIATENELKLVKEKLENMLKAERKEFDRNNASCRHGNSGKPRQGDANNEIEAVANLLEHKTSLWELFQQTKIVEGKTESIMKKTLKRKKIQPAASSKQYCTAAAVGTLNYDLADEKLHKIPRMLHRVHAEASAISRKSQNLWNYVTRSNNFINDEEEYRNRNQALSDDDDIIIFPYSENDTKSNMSDHAYGNRKREYWIKSDAEYLILEL